VQIRKKTLAACGLEEPCASFPDFCNNHQFHVIYCVSSRLCTLFRRISDSRFTWIHDFEENLTESVGPVPFSAQYLICRHVRTEELIRVGLGNLRFLQVKLSVNSLTPKCILTGTKNSLSEDFLLA
jgi:hypothetical protein